MDKSPLGDRMKMWETQNKSVLDTNKPIIIRLDGKGFSKFTKGFKKPFDPELSACMMWAIAEVCKEMQQAIFAYSQSDEVTILLDGWQSPRSEMWFGGKVEKITSVSASLMTYWFNRYVSALFEKRSMKPKPAYFDSRAFNIPEYDVENVFIWRQIDAKRNSIQGYGRNYFSHKELNGVNGLDIIDKLKEEKGVDWYNLPPVNKWGFIVRKENYNLKKDDTVVIRSRWSNLLVIPEFVKNRDFLKSMIYNNSVNTTNLTNDVVDNKRSE